MVLGESRHFLMSAPFLPDLSTPGSALSPAFKRGIKELSLAVSAGAENEPEWTVTEHMDGTPMYIAPENRLRIW